MIQPRILYIMGDGRSGSTVLGIILGNHPHMECVGELKRWLEFGGNPKPGNEKRSDHEFWAAVKEIYSRELPVGDFAALRMIQARVESYDRFPWTIFGLIPTNVRNAYTAHLLALLAAIGTISRKAVIVDISKNMGRACMLLRISASKVRVIHLVRDPRGVLWSQLKQNIEQNYKSPIKSLIDYSIKNLFSQCVKLVAPRGTIIRMRYEDFVNQPVRELHRIGALMDLPMDDLATRLVNGASLKVGPLIDGNRIRNEATIHLGPDDDWRTNLRRRYQLVAVLATLPFFLLYKYYKPN